MRLAAPAAVAMVAAAIGVDAQVGSAGPILAACRDSSPPHATASRDGRPSRDLLSHLGVLRSQQRSGDLSRAIGERVFHEFNVLHRVAVRYVRRVGTGPSRERYYVVPGTVRPSVETTPVLCRHRAPPGTSRRAELTRERRAIRSFGLYLVSIDRDGGFNTPTGLGGRVRELLGNEIATASSDEAHTTLAGLVPDGIASVRLTFQGRTRGDRVARNFWVVRLPESVPPDELSGLTTEWLGPGGRVRRTFHGIGD